MNVFFNDNSQIRNLQKQIQKEIFITKADENEDNSDKLIKTSININVINSKEKIDLIKSEIRKADKSFNTTISETTNKLLNRIQVKDLHELHNKIPYSNKTEGIKTYSNKNNNTLSKPQEKKINNKHAESYESPIRKITSSKKSKFDSNNSHKQTKKIKNIFVNSNPKNNSNFKSTETKKLTNKLKNKYFSEENNFPKNQHQFNTVVARNNTAVNIKNTDYNKTQNYLKQLILVSKSDNLAGAAHFSNETGTEIEFNNRNLAVNDKAENNNFFEISNSQKISVLNGSYQNNNHNYNYEEDMNFNSHNSLS